MVIINDEFPSLYINYKLEYIYCQEKFRHMSVSGFYFSYCETIFLVIIYELWRKVERVKRTGEFKDI